MMPPELDAVVIGAGVAGSSAAILLAQAGARVGLLEAATFPHDKLCGEFLSPEVEPLLRRLGAWPAIQRLDPPRLTGARITSRSGATWTTTFPAPALGVSRRALDALLFERAGQVGTQTLTGARVTGVTGSLEEGFTVTWRAAGDEVQTARARVVLGAWGKHAPLDRALGRDFLRQSHPTFGLKAHFYGPPLARRVELHGFAGGYCGLGEIEGGQVNLCLLAETRRLKACGGDPDRFVETVLSTNPHLRDWLAQAERVQPRFLAVSQIPFVRKRQVEAGILMLGDTAGLISPLAGNGMAMAMTAAEMATPLALAFLDGGLSGDDLAAEYTRQWQARFRARLALGRVIQPLMFRPRVLGLGLRLMRIAPGVGSALVTHTRDPLPKRHAALGMLGEE